MITVKIIKGKSIIEARGDINDILILLKSLGEDIDTSVTNPYKSNKENMIKLKK